MKFNCPVCGKAIKVKDGLAGRKGKCPACQNPIVVHQPADPKTAPSCPGCGKRIKNKPELAGRKVKCPACNEAFTMPGPVKEEVGASVNVNPTPAAPTFPPPLPIGSDKFKPPKNIGAAANRGAYGQQNAIPGPDPSGSFFARLFYTRPAEKKEINGLIFGAALIGGIGGYIWGGLFNPFQEEGVLSALLNLFLFAGWGAAEIVGLLMARNILRIPKPGVLMAYGAVCGGFWCGVWVAVDNIVGALPGEDSFFLAIVSLIIGFLFCGLLSLLSVFKLSKQMTFAGN